MQFWLHENRNTPWKLKTKTLDSFKNIVKPNLEFMLKSEDYLDGRQKEN